jgi:pilus assembly protein CpaE
MKNESSAVREWKLLLITDMPEIEDDVKDNLTGLNVSLQVINYQETRAEVFRASPDLVLLHEPKEGMVSETVGFILGESPLSSVIYLAESRDFGVMREVLRAGAMDVLILPDEGPMLGDLVRRALRRRQETDCATDDVVNNTAIAARGKGQVLAVYSGKGGCGKTLLTATLAQTLQLDYPFTVLVVDLNLQFGGVEMVLGLGGNRSLYDLIPVIDELNEIYLRNVTVRVPISQLDVLLSPADAEKAEQIKPEHIQRLLRVARRYYDYIIVDMPGWMDENNYMVLNEADRILYVLSPEIPALKVFRQVLDLWRKLSVDTGPEHLQVLFNRVNYTSEVTVKELNKLDEIHLLGTVKEDYKHIKTAYNMGTPLRLTPNDRRLSPFARDLRKIAQKLVGELSDVDAKGSSQEQPVPKETDVLETKPAGGKISATI